MHEHATMNPAALIADGKSATSLPPFNIRYSIPPVEEHQTSRTPNATGAFDKNMTTAAILSHIDQPLAHRIRNCGPRSRCRARKYCAYCGPIQAQQFGRKYMPKLLKLPNAAHLTLSTPAIPRLTKYDLTALKKRFDHLRERERFKNAVMGGVVNYQVKYGGRGWLPHVHSVLDYRDGLSKNWLKNTWSTLGGGWFVKFQLINPGEQPIVLNYDASKQRLPDDPNLFRQFYEATTGIILIQPWGTLHPLHGRKPRLMTLLETEKTIK